MGTFARRIRRADREGTDSPSQNGRHAYSVQNGAALPNPVGDPDLRHRAGMALERSIANYDPPAAEEPDTEKLQRLERAMQSMPRITREIFMAHRLDHYSYAKIAEITGLSIKQIERQMAKAIYQLCRYMDGDQRASWQRRIDRWFR